MLGMAMEKKKAKFGLGRQSSMALEREENTEEDEEREMTEDNMQLLYLANGGDVAAIEALLDSGTDVNSAYFDRRTALHVATCEGRKNVVALLLSRGANVNSQDRWGSTPLADAIHYKNYAVCKLLEENGAMLSMAPMHVTNEHDIPDYEVDPDELDFRNSVQITKVIFR
jgi:ankyrin repeat protein